MPNIYVIFYEGLLYKNNGRRGVYTSLASARKVVSEDTKNITLKLCSKEAIDFYKLSSLDKEKWMDKVKRKFTIKKFVEETN